MKHQISDEIVNRVDRRKKKVDLETKNRLETQNWKKEIKKM